MTPWDDGFWDSGTWDSTGPAPALFQTPKPPRKRMPKNDYIQNSDEPFAQQLLTFRNNITPYIATLSLTAAQVSSQSADALYFQFLVACQDLARDFGQQCTAWKTILRRGGEPPGTGVPQVPSFGTPPPVVAAGIEPRFRALAQQIKSHPAYNTAIGEALGIEGTVQGGPDYDELQPEISARVVGSRVDVDWNWGGNRAFLDMCEIQVDRGTGFVLLAFDTTPGYSDTQPFPATPTRWTYRAIYRKGDAQVGQWSQLATVTVG